MKKGPSPCGAHTGCSHQHQALLWKVCQRGGGGDGSERTSGATPWRLFPGPWLTVTACSLQPGSGGIIANRLILGTSLIQDTRPASVQSPHQGQASPDTALLAGLLPCPPLLH